MTWQRSTRDCTECDGRAVAKTDQYGAVKHFECEGCGATIEADSDG